MLRSLFQRLRASRHTVLAMGMALLLLCAVRVSGEECVGNACFSANEQSNTLLFMRALQASAGISTWPSDNDQFCTWPGVNCISWLTVVDDLDANTLSGTLPEIGGDINVSAVTLFRLYLNDQPGISGTLPASWRQLPLLTTVDVSGTSVNGTLPAEWANMPRLAGFFGNSSQLSGTLPPEWSTNEWLFNINLDNTSISGTLPPEWSALSNLGYVHVSNTQVSGTLPAEWLTVSCLYAANTALSGTLPSAWAANAKLYIVDVSGTNVTGSLPATWGGTGVLAEFYASQTRLSGSLPVAWGNMSQLQQFHLAYTDVSGTIPEAYSGMGFLLRANFTGTRLHGCMPANWTVKGLTPAMIGLDDSDCPTTKAPATSSNDGAVRLVLSWVAAAMIAAAVLL